MPLSALSSPVAQMRLSPLSWPPVAEMPLSPFSPVA
jgi:hypothetical protein